MINGIPNNTLDYILTAAGYDTHTYKAILLYDLTFDPDTHETLSDVTANQISTKNGYTQNSKTLANGTISIDTSNDLAKVVFDTFNWTADTSTDATGFGPFDAMAIYDDTHADDIIVLYVDFETTTTATDGVIIEQVTPTINLQLSS